ncbi:MAG: hotdog domain-containing protein [Promethearchaeota archaeon]
MKQQTHEEINKELSGTPILLQEGYSKIELLTTNKMRADKTGLIHGGFIFSLADHAAMLAINHPNVVLGAAHVKFLKPVREGQTIIAEAIITKKEGKKIFVHVDVRFENSSVFEGEFTCFIPKHHVLETRK